MKMRRLIVLDTNCLLQALPKISPYHCVWTDFLAGYYFLCISNEILTEYLEIIGRQSSSAIAEDIVAAIIESPYVIHYEPYFRFRLIEQDPDDNKFVDCAIVAGADYIVSEDSHFRVLETIPFPSVNVIGLEEFVTSLKKNGETESDIIN